MMIITIRKINITRFIFWDKKLWQTIVQITFEDLVFHIYEIPSKAKTNNPDVF